jgi:uncharacterized membrane protein
MPTHLNQPPQTAWFARRLPEVYLLVALFVCGLLALLTVPFYAPDESAHAWREYQIAHGRILAERTGQGSGGLVDTNLVAVSNALYRLRVAFLALHPDQRRRLPPGRVTEAGLAPLEPIHWSHQQAFTRFENTALYPPGLYLPQAVGLRFGESFGLTIEHSLILARLLTAVCAIALGWLALRLAGPERWLLFPYLLLPTGLSLAASCSQDALIAPIMALLAVLLFRAIGQRRLQTTAELLISGCLLALLSGARVTYLPLVLTLLLPSVESARPGWRRLARPLAVMAAAVALVAGWSLAVHHLGAAVAAGANPAQQEAMLERHPFAGCLSLLDAFVEVIPVTLIKGLYMLGTNDVGPPHWVYAVMVLGMAAFVSLHPVAGLRSRWSKLLLAFSLLAVAAGTWLAEYLLWTPVGAHRVEGLQSRYFLPLIPLALVFGWTGLPGKLPTLRPVTVSRLSLTAAAVFLPAVLYAPWATAYAYYLSGVWRALSWVTR